MIVITCIIYFQCSPNTIFKTAVNVASDILPPSTKEIFFLALFVLPIFAISILGEQREEVWLPTAILSSLKSSLDFHSCWHRSNHIHSFNLGKDFHFIQFMKHIWV